MVRLLLVFRLWHLCSGRVSIPQWCDCCSCNEAATTFASCCFNPTMVRLLLITPVKMNPSRPTFQSHNGAIAAFVPDIQADDGIKVSIPQWCDCCKAKSQDAQLPQLVSIPQWCDCCLPRHNASPSQLRVSIPQWCDCCNHPAVALLDRPKFQSHNGAIAAKS